MPKIIDGKKISAEIKDELKEKVAAYRAEGKEIALAVIQVGNDPASTVYVSNSGKIHLRSNCSGMKYYSVMTYGVAKSRGYTECKDCF